MLYSGRHSSCKVSRVLNIMYADCGNDDRVPVVFLDALEDLFLSYLFTTLYKFGFGDSAEMFPLPHHTQIALYLSRKVAMKGIL